MCLSLFYSNSNTGLDNWLSPEEGCTLCEKPTPQHLKCHTNAERARMALPGKTKEGSPPHNVLQDHQPHSFCQVRGPSTTADQVFFAFVSATLLFCSSKMNLIKLMIVGIKWGENKKLCFFDKITNLRLHSLAQIQVSQTPAGV